MIPQNRVCCQRGSSAPDDRLSGRPVKDLTGENPDNGTYDAALASGEECSHLRLIEGRPPDLGDLPAAEVVDVHVLPLVGYAVALGT